MATTSTIALDETVTRRRRAGINFLPALLLLPSIILIGGVIAWPLLTGISYSVHGGTLLTTGPFVGLDNYIQLATLDEFYHALRFSVIFAVVNVVLCYSLGLGIALLMDMDVPGRAFSESPFCSHGSSPPLCQPSVGDG
ncbi:carbohydrate ABC transporter permease [Bradyrhizobium sp. RDT10]